MVLGGKYPTGKRLINSQKPIFPRSIARMSHSEVHETEKVLDAAIEAVEVQGMKNRYGVIETGGFCPCHGTFRTGSLITVLISAAYPLVIISINYSQAKLSSASTKSGIMVFRDLRTCSLVHEQRYFRELCCLLLQDKRDFTLAEFSRNLLLLYPGYKNQCTYPLI